MTRINTNVSSLNAQKTLARTNQSLQTSMTRLSTGLRINSGKDDPAGMIAAAIQTNNIAAMKKAIDNTQRGSQMIATADSALGQITSLLSDIRGLVTEVGNTAVMDANQIAANQLQVDSALQAIDRISQVTTFQGQKLLDGGLDFTNTSQLVPQIQNLRIDTANLGATGQLGVTVEVAAHAERADITTSSGEQQATSRLTFAARAMLYDDAGGDIWVQANSNSSAYEGVKFTFALGGVDAGAASYNTVTKTLTVTGTTNTTWTQAVAAINNDVGDLFTASGANGDSAIEGASAPTNDTLNQTSLDITAVAKGIDFNNVKVKMESSATVTSGSATANYNEDAKELTITVNNGTSGGTAANRLTDSVDFATIVTQINAVTLSDGSAAFTATYPTTGGANTDRVFGMVAADSEALANTSVSGYMNSAFSAATRAKGTLTLAAGGTLNLNTAGTFAFAAGGGGVVALKANSPTVAASTIHFVDNDLNKGSETAAYAGTTLTINMAADTDATDSSTIQEIIDAINTDGTFTATLISGDAATGFFANGTIPADFDTTAASVDIKATSLGDAADNVKITLHNDATAAGQETAVYDALKKTLDVHVHATSTMAQMVTAINASTDATTGAATNAWKATNLNPTVTNNGAFSVMPAAFYTTTDSVSVESLNAGANFNNMQIQFETVSSLSSGVKALASYDEANNTFTIQVKNSEAATDAVTLQDISDAISAVNGFAGSYLTKNAAAGVSQSSARIFGKAVDTTAIGNTGSTGGNALLADLAVEIGSSTGQQVFTFKAGSTANQVASAINVVSDAIGVVAYQDNALLDLKSAAYGAKAFVSVNVISEGSGGQLKRSASALRATGTDADAKINGVQATANGNELSINSSSLAMTLNMQAETNGNFRFNITGGGAQFQLGPDVVSNQQLRIGIQSVNTARMGGVDGKLYQLASGGSASLINNATLAAKIADQAINTVTSLRGRLGAIQGLTMDTNQKTLEDMVQNMQTALSQIQDTDFAAETANLTRAQILTQSGMAVLSIANQAPQQVLSLLPRG